MRIPPPEVVATWPAPDYDNPESLGPALLITELTVMPLALVALGARLYCRIARVHSPGWDDLLMTLAAAVGIGATICVILANQSYGWSIHVWDLTMHQAIRGRQISVAAQALFHIASNLARLSILTSYLRIAPSHSWLRRLSLGSIWVVTAITLSFFIVLWTQCIPMSDYWDIENAHRHCIEEGPPLMAVTILSVVTDVLVYLLPMPTLVNLRLPLNQRIGLIVVFSLGLLVVVAGCMRTYWLHYVLYKTFDITWYGFQLWIWTALEVNLGVICGCIPTLRPLFRSKEHALHLSRSGGPTSRIGSDNTQRASHGSRLTTTWIESRGRATIVANSSERDPESESVTGLREIESPVSVFELHSWLQDKRKHDFVSSRAVHKEEQ